MVFMDFLSFTVVFEVLTTKTTVETQKDPFISKSLKHGFWWFRY